MISKNQQIKAFVLLFLAFLVPQLAHSAERCQAGSHWVRPHSRKGYVRHDGKKFAATQVRGHCRRNPRGYEKWHQRLSNKRPEIWGYVKEQTKKWSTAEVERVYDALSILPDRLLNLKNVKIHRMRRSKFVGNPATTNLRDVTLYDLAFEHKDPLGQIIAHELTHALHSNFKEKDWVSFAEAAGWEYLKLPDNSYYFKPSSQKRFIKPDSQISIKEDLANHVEYYLFKNTELKTRSKGGYNWVLKRFGKNFKLKKASSK